MLILSIYDERKCSAIFIEKTLREKYGIRIGNNKVQEVLQHMAGISKKGKNRGEEKKMGKI